MKKHLVIAISLLSCLAFSQPNLENLYIGGFQRSNSRIVNGNVESRNKLGNLTVSGLIVNKKGVFHTDITYLTGFVLKGFKRPESLEGGVYEAGWGTTFRNKERSRWGWSADVMYRSLNVRGMSWDTINDKKLSAQTPTEFQANYVGVGGTIYYLKQFGDRVFVMPRFGLAYGGANFVSSRSAFAQVAISIGVPIYNEWGASITLGAYGYGKDLDQEQYGKDAREGVNLRYVQIGLARCFGSD